MNSRRRLNVAGKSIVTSFLLGLVLFGAWATRRDLAHEGWLGDAPLQNYGVIWDHKLTRSGMPHVDGGWKWLRAQGVRSVVTFRQENDVNYDEFGFVRVLHLPMSGHKFPTEEQAGHFLQFIQDANNQPVHIHCTLGRDRTGMMTALTRYAVDGWPLDKALAEARMYRGGKDLSPRMIAWLQDWAAKHQPGSSRLHGEATVAR